MRNFRWPLWSVALTVALFALNARAQDLASLIQYGLENSLDGKISELDVRVQERSAKVIDQSRLIPQVNLSASYAQNTYDRSYDRGTQSISNNGINPIVSLTATYDLQKLIGPDSELAREATVVAELQRKITARGVVRSIKRSYFAIVELQSEIDELEKLIRLFARVDEVLQKQKSLGINNEIERQQFKAQQSLLQTDLEGRRADQDGQYLQLSTQLNLDLALTKQKLAEVAHLPPLHYASVIVDTEHLTQIRDDEMIHNLAKDYDLAKLEYQTYRAIPLPSVYVRASRSTPTMPSADGPQTSGEVGVSFPLDSFVTRQTQKSQLNAKLERSHAVMERALLDYRNQIRLNALNLNRLKAQTDSLAKARGETKKLLDKVFLFYAQKRVDTLGALDILQKYLQASRNSLANTLQIQILDSELEYLVGGAA